MDVKSIGKIIDGHGIKGELKVKFFSSETDWYNNLKFVYIDDTKYEVKELRLNKQFNILKLKEIVSRTQAESLKGKLLFGSKDLFVTHEGEEPYLSELLTFDINLDNEIIGSVCSFKETLAHFLIVVKTKKGFFEIPYVDHFIDKVDRNSKVVYMNFPKDLLSDEFKLDEEF